MPETEKKPRVLIMPLCGRERDRWINPSLVCSLLVMLRDPRFDTEMHCAYNFRPVDFCRNCCVSVARECGYDWLGMIDNDQTLSSHSQIMDCIAEAGPHQDVIAFYAGTHSFEDIYRFNVSQKIPLTREGNFTESDFLGSGVIMLRKTVWERIPNGPWFRTLQKDDERLTLALGEDEYFSQLAIRTGLRLWYYNQPAGHLKTSDATFLAERLSYQTP